MRIISLALVALSFVGCGRENENEKISERGIISESETIGLTKSGIPAGQHFGLNLIGVPKDKSPSLTGGSGHRIFLPLFGAAKILLSEGEFAVLDANGTDGSASFQLPNPDPDGDGVTSYSVFARALGKPGGSLKATTCATDPATGEEICSLETMVSTRTSGRSKFVNVSRELLSISADIDGDGTLDRVSLFDDRLVDYFWSLDNQGLRILQLRFIQVPSKL
ncbi:MAG: hypothetical protein ACO3A4_04800 [Silvanigrellaceae bacterium]